MNWCPVVAWFLESILDSFSGGYNELEVATCCLTPEIGGSFEAKARAALAEWNEGERDVSLWLTDDEAMLLGLAAENCKNYILPCPQRERLENWAAKWRASDYATEALLEPVW